MDNSQFYEQALAIVKTAVEADGKKDYDTAYSLYTKAVSRFLSGMQCKYISSLYESIACEDPTLCHHYNYTV